MNNPNKLVNRTAEMMRRQTQVVIKAKLMKVLGESSHRIVWTSQQFDRAMKPLVYIYWQDPARTIALYIGMSKHGIGRPLHNGHQKGECRQYANAIEFLICDSPDHAVLLEKKLIRLLKPKFNDVGVVRRNQIPQFVTAQMMKDSFYSK